MVVFPLCDSISLDKLHYIWSDCAKTVHSLWFVQHHINGSIFKTENNSKNTLQASPDFGEKFPHLLTKMGSKTLVPPSLTTKNRVKLCQILSNQDKQYQRFLALKSPGKPWFSGVSPWRSNYIASNILIDIWLGSYRGVHLCFEWYFRLNRTYKRHLYRGARHS